MFPISFVALCLFVGPDDAGPNMPVGRPSDTKRSIVVPNRQQQSVQPTSHSESALSRKLAPSTQAKLIPAIEKNGEEAPPAQQGETAIGRRIGPRTRSSPFTQKVANNKPATEPNEENTTTARRTTWWMSTVGGLLIVLSAIVLSAKFLRTMTGTTLLGSTASPLHVLHRIPLGPRQSACLLRVGDRLLLVGMAGDQLRTLAEITDPVEIDAIKGQCMQLAPKSATRGFADMLTKKSKIYSDEEEKEAPGPRDETSPPADLSQFLRVMRSKVLPRAERPGGNA